MIPEDYWRYRTKFSITLMGLTWIQGFTEVQGGNTSNVPCRESMRVINDKVIRILKEVEEWPRDGADPGATLGGSPAPDR